jgi:hypothetical protein
LTTEDEDEEMAGVPEAVVTEEMIADTWIVTTDRETQVITGEEGVRGMVMADADVDAGVMRRLKNRSMRT